MSDGFLGRWSRRKLDVKEGRAVEPEPLVEPQPVIPAEAGIQGALDPRLRGDDEAEKPPPPTLEDAQALTPESDFRRFAMSDVTPDVKNAAMKKLFADPRYNVMDGMDVYTGDYSQPDPMPESMLRSLASAKFLGLFDQQEEEEAAGPRDVADNPKAQTVAQSGEAPTAVPEPPPHADPDLRLQQDHAAAGEDPGDGTG
jgi:hypothetical protein